MTITHNAVEFAQTEVGAIVAQFPASARLFEAYHIDYCCQGSKTLAEACAAAKLNVHQLCNEIAGLTSLPADTGEDWLQRPLSELCDHIERQYHDQLRRELPRLALLVDKVIRAHGLNHPELTEIKAAFEALRAELEPHMLKEEHVLFPSIRRMEATGKRETLPFGSVKNPIACMVREHENAGDQLARLRALTDQFTPPQDACPTYRVLYDGLRELELEMHQHVHKENNVLFPRAIELESRLAD